MSLQIHIDATVVDALQRDIRDVLKGQPIAKTCSDLMGNHGIGGVAIYVVAERFVDRFDAAIDAGFPELVRKPGNLGGAS